MPLLLPTLHKTWQFAVNNTLATTAAAPARRFITVKDALKSFTLNPWLVKGSSDSLTSGMDDVDRLTDHTKIVGSATLVRSWIVLRQPSGLHFCLVFDHANIFQASTVVSRVGFGTANGGTNGTTSARPTATDEIVLTTQAYWGPQLFDTSNGVTHILHAADGLASIVAFARAGILEGLWLLGRPVAPVSGWTDPLYALVKATGGAGSPNYVNHAHLWQTFTPAFKGWAPAGAMSMFGSTLTAATGALYPWPVASDAADSVSGVHPVQPIGLWSNTVGARGRHGVLPDLFFVPGSIVDGSLMGNKALAVMSEFAMPWDGVSNCLMTV